MKNFSIFNFRTLAFAAAMIVSLVTMADNYTQEFTYQAFKYKLDTSKKTAQLVQDPDYQYYFSVSVPRTITYKNEDYTVNEIGASAFKNCTKIKEIYLPSSVTSIYTGAFYGCSGVTKVTMDAAISMNSTIFTDMADLEEVRLSAISKTKSIGTRTFASLKKLKTFISYSPALTKIDANAFVGCTSLGEASFYSAEITSIGNSAFENCASLTTLYFQKKTLVSIGDNAFTNCSNFNHDFSAMPLVSIGKQAFYKSGITTFPFPSTLENLGDYAFSQTSLTSVNLSTTKVTAFPEGVFSSNEQLSSINLPTGLTSIGRKAFANNPALKSFTINTCPVTNIGSEAFANCGNLTRVTLPATLTTIYDAFNGCNALKQVISNATLAPKIAAEDLFTNCTTTANDRILILTNGSRTDTYYSNNWDKFFKIASPVPTDIKLSDTSVSLWAGTSTHTLTTTMAPATANNVVTWTSSNDAVATVNNGIITPKTAGTCTITATTSNGLKATCSVTVQDVTSVTLNNTSARIQKGSSIQLHATVAPANACQDITWVSSDPSVASVNFGGVVTAYSKGTCTISAYSWNKKKVATCRVTVTQPEIGLDYYSQLLKPGENVTIKATAPSSDYMSFKWTSSNSSVATVDNWGYITAVSEGTAVISCSPSSGTLSSITAPAKCVVTVSNNEYIYVGNIYYLPIDGEPTHLKVTNMGLEIESSYTVDADRNEYSATVSIPDVIPYKGKNYTVTQIGKYAFYRMKDLQMVVVPNTVEIIDEHAFERSEKMVRVTFTTGSKLHTIKQCAFKKCSILNYVTLPNTVKNVGVSIFEDCVGMSDLSLSTGMTYVSDRMCYNCEVLDNLILPDGIVTIGKSAFMNCDELKDITYSQNLTLIDEHAFSNCISLASVNLPAKTAAIQDYAYTGCTSLKNFITPYSLEGIGAQCFNNCPALESIELKPAKPMTIGESAFYDCGLKKVIVGNLGIWVQNNYANMYANPLAVAQHLYMGTTEITDFAIPNTTNYINQYAFAGCRSIKSAIIPSTVTIVSDHIFKNCESLTSVRIDATTPPLFVGTRDIREMVDLFTTNKTNITVPAASLAAYQKDPFWGLFTLNGVASTMEKPDTWDDGILVSRRNVMLKPGEKYQIGILDGLDTYDISFTSSNSTVATVSNNGEITAGTTGTSVIRLQQKTNSSHYKSILVTVSEITPTYVGSIYYTPTERKTMSVTGMGYGNDPYYPTEVYRYEYSGIVNLPATVTYGNTYTVDEIEPYALYCMRHLQKTFVPASVTTIGTRAFEDSKYMQRVEFGTNSKLNRMDARAFYRCKVLDQVALPDGLFLIDKSTFRYCDELKSIKLPAKLSMIDEYGFANCISLKTIGLPSTLASIQNYCFAFDKVLDNITVPASMVGIGAYCFRDCSALQSIRFSNTKAMTIGESAFYNCDGLKTTYVDNIARYVETNFYNEMANPTYFSKFIGQNGKELRQVVVPSTATYINQFALVNCKNITRVDLPASIATVSDHIFLGCSSLHQVISRATVPPAFIGTREPEDMVANIDNGNTTIFDRATLYVQAGAIAKYGKDSYWKLYHKIADINTIDAGDVNSDGVINASDVVSVYNFILEGEKSGISRARADVNGDNQVNTTDVIAIYNIIIEGN